MKNPFGRACLHASTRTNEELLAQLHDYCRLARNVAAHVLYKRLGTRPPTLSQRVIREMYEEQAFAHGTID
jgi:transcriptional regulator of NAD metabolism